MDWTAVITSVVAATASITTGFFIMRAQSRAIGGVDRRIDGIDRRIDGVDRSVKNLDQRMSQRMDGLDQRMDGLDQRMDGLDQRIDGLGNALNQLRTLVAQVIGYLQGKDNHQLFIPTETVPTLEKNSPCRLNKRGLQVATELDAHSLVDKHYSEIAIPDGASELEIQKQCFAFAHTILLQIVNADEKAKIEKAIYEDGGNVDSTLYVYGVLFRDKFLEQFGYPVPS